ncbi:MAG: helix-turn-helix domain-containing protein [Pseudonocardiaceae bacterium]|nr:helix-turn-helix domain-containing protein [Pseudonocardiaceae bacterium]
MNPEKRQLILGDSLRRLREQAGYDTGKEFAEHIGWMASKVSRIENGRTLPADSDVAVWLDAIDAPDTAAAEIRDEVRDIRLARDSWRQQLRRGHADRQRAEAVAEHEAARITVVEPFLVPGLVQTADYARAVFTIAAEIHETPADTDDAVRERIRRQDVLYNPDKHIEILIAETALRYPICPAPVMGPQLDRLANLVGLPHVRLGVIPIDKVLPTITMHGYAILDDSVTIEINHTELAVTDPDEVALYRRITDGLWEAATEGNEARAILQRVTADLRTT